MTQEWREVGSEEDLRLHGWVVARVDGREVGVVLDPVTGAAHGMRNRCPHHGAPLCLGSVRERSAGEPGTYRLSGRRVLRCPWHGWEFDVDSGGCLDDGRMRVAVYPVRIEDGRVLVRA